MYLKHRIYDHNFYESQVGLMIYFFFLLSIKLLSPVHFCLDKKFDHQSVHSIQNLFPRLVYLTPNAFRLT